MRIRLRDVAEQAGVSMATASLVLNDKAEAIPDDTRTRVFAAADELGYRPNALARSLRSQKSHTIGFVSDQVVTTPYAGELIRGAQKVADARGFVVLLANIGEHPATANSGIEALLDRQVDAVIFATMYHRVIDVPNVLASVPTVLLNARSRGKPGWAVVPDEYAGATAAVELLIAAGHTRIGYVSVRNRPPAALERETAYRDALTRHGLATRADFEVAGESDSAGGRDAAMEVLDRQDRPTALFCFNDRLAAGAYIAAARLGLRVPEDLSIVGFDNQVLIAESIDPPLTTVQLPHFEMGRWAMEQALSLLDEEEEPRLHRMPCPPVERASVAPPNIQEPTKR